MANKTLSPQERKVARSKAKLENFAKLAPKRMDRALKSIEVVGNLANRNSYTYDEKHVTKILTALADAVKVVGARFSAPASKSQGTGFTF